MSSDKRLSQTIGKGVMIAALIAPIILNFGCGSSKKRAKTGSESAETSQTPAVTNNAIDEIRVQESDSKTVVSITCLMEPDQASFKLSDPPRVVFDFNNTELRDISGPLAVNNGTINEINVSAVGDQANPFTRVVIGFDQIVEHNVVPEGKTLRIEIPRIGPAPQGVQDLVLKSNISAEPPAGEAVAAVEDPNAIPATDAPLGDLPAESATSVLDATQITDVMVEPSGEGVIVTFQADGKISQFEVKDLQDPARIAVDFPGLKSGAKKKNVKGSGPIKGIRFGSHADKVRLVLDSKTKGQLPTYQSEVKDDRFLLYVGNTEVRPEGAGDVASSPDLTPLPEETPLSTDPVPPLADTAAATPVPSQIEKIAGLDFKQMPGASRIIVTAPEGITYETMPYADGKVRIDLYGARIPKPLQRSLDTSEFDSPVLMISAYPVKGQAGLVRLDVKLREEVPVTVNREGGAINIDFERTKVFVAQEKATVPETVANPADVASASSGSGDDSLTGLEEPSAIDAPLSDPASDPMSKPSGTEKDLFSDRNTLISGTGTESSSNLDSNPGQFGDVLSGSGIGSGGRFTGRRISLDFKDADIKNIFRLIAEVSKLNIVVGDGVSGDVTLRLINVPWDQALAIILQSKKLGIVRYDNILRIAPLKELESERKEALSAKEAERDLEDLKVLVLPINYTKADDLRTKIQNLLSKRGKITVDTRTNVLIVEDIQEVLVKARSLTKTLDTSTPQVVIDARIVSASRNWQRNLGIQWGGHFQASSATGNPTGLDFPSSIGVGGGSGATGASLDASPRFPGFNSPNFAVSVPAVAERGAIGLSFGSLNDIANLDVRLAALEDQAKIRVISSPRVVTLDNIAAKINQGAKVPFATVSSAGTQTQFVDATLELNVTPRVTNDRRVSMQVTLTNNSVGQLTSASPQIDIAEANTTILVKDGDTAVLGGIFVIDDQNTQNAIPFFKDIPGLGVLFKNQTRVNNKRELLFFITPRIVQQNIALTE